MSNEGVSGKLVCNEVRRLPLDTSASRTSSCCPAPLTGTRSSRGGVLGLLGLDSVPGFCPIKGKADRLADESDISKPMHCPASGLRGSELLCYQWDSGGLRPERGGKWGFGLPGTDVWGFGGAVFGEPRRAEKLRLDGV